MNNKYMVTFSAGGVPDVTVLLDNTPANLVSGYGGWLVVSRQRQIGLTQWQGKDPLRMAVPILFDSVRSRAGCEVDISRLSRMALPPLSGGEPPVVNVSGAAVPEPGPTDWVIENLQWGTNVIYDFDESGSMSRMRQDCVVNLLQYVADDRTAFSSLQPGMVNGKSKAGWPKSYISKQGDTAQSIAAQFYGSAAKWNKIAAANGIRDPRTIVKNTRLTIPAP